MTYGPGLQFAEINGKRRSVYRQLDGTIILADECKCGVRFELDCPIDDHAIKASAQEMREQPNGDV